MDNRETDKLFRTIDEQMAPAMMSNVGNIIAHVVFTAVPVPASFSIFSSVILLPPHYQEDNFHIAQLS